MAVAEALFAGLIDDAAMFPPGNASVTAAVAAHADYRRSWFAPLIGPLVVRDDELTRVGAAAIEAGETLVVSVVNRGGAGGLVALAGTSVAGLRVVAVESALRDLGDLRGNATRVVTAAAELGEDIAVFVEFPFAAGWERAVEEVEAAGLFGKIRTGGPEPADTPPCGQLARQLAVLIDADLPFKATAGLHHAWAEPGPDPDQPRWHGFLNVLLAIDAIVGGASEPDAVRLLGSAESGVLLDRLRAWGDREIGRVRRMFRSFGCCGVLDPVGDLTAAGLVEPR